MAANVDQPELPLEIPPSPPTEAWGDFRHPPLIPLAFPPSCRHAFTLPVQNSARQRCVS